jgi:hypothetical protein
LAINKPEAYLQATSPVAFARKDTYQRRKVMIGWLNQFGRG